MYDHFFKEIQAEHPDQIIYCQKGGEERQDSFVGETKQCLNIMLKDKEQQQQEIKAQCASEAYITSEQLMVQIYRRIAVKSAERVQQPDDTLLEKLQNDEEERNENVNCFIKILQMKVWERLRDTSSYIDEVNLIYLVDRFASEEDIAECQQSQESPENEQAILQNFLQSAVIKKKVLQNIFVREMLIQVIEDIILLNIQQTSLQVLSLMSLQEKFQLILQRARIIFDEFELKVQELKLLETKNEQATMDMDPPGLLGLLQGGHHHDMKMKGESDMQVQNVDLDEELSPKDRPPYESLLEEQNNARDSTILTSAVRPTALRGEAYDQHAFAIPSLENHLQMVTYDQLKENDLLAKYNCYTSYEQLPTDREFEVTIKSIQSMYYHAEKSSDQRSRQQLDLSLLQIFHGYNVQKTQIKELSDKAAILRQQLEQCELDRNEALKLRARDKVRESEYDQQSKDNDQRIQELSELVQQNEIDFEKQLATIKIAQQEAQTAKDEKE